MNFDATKTKFLLALNFEGFWGTNRTGKVNKYNLNKIENVEFGLSSRLIFLYNGKSIVLPLKEENLKRIKEVLNY